MTGSREMTRGMSGELYICPAILIFHQTYSDLREDQTIDARGLRRAWRGKRKFILLGCGDRLDAAHLYRCGPVSLSPFSLIPLPRIASRLPSRPPPFASASLRRRLRPRGADRFARVLPLVSRLTADHVVVEKAFAAIDELALARHVADRPKTRQTRPTSHSTPRPMTGLWSWWAEGMTRRAAPGSCLGCVV